MNVKCAANSPRSIRIGEVMYVPGLWPVPPSLGGPGEGDACARNPPIATCIGKGMG